ncbi:hypothetical protein FISHEDRAFT_36490 [Fistulina hepatica ATCC 64428]|uniref:F-box domain-containing protein n=1 Tax=Fistulina hepatica ATCC 64428 TaxID=1128425 RepID=A0A0D7AIZ1_9AGAR|nr:hypothetical protein FISHEDRAFT_36490 [Fistulina hepatica ATCC 64428]
MTVLSSNYLLEKSILDFTTATTREALQGAENQQKTASHALEFFVSLLDESNPAEKEKLTLFRDCLDALDDGSLRPGVLARLGPCEQQPHSVLVSETCTKVTHLSAARQVLHLADLLYIILFYVDSIKTLHAMTLVSRTMHRLAQVHLWSYPRDLDTIEQQVQFAFGASISGALSEPLGLRVKRLHIRRLPKGANDRLLIKIAQLCPHAEDVMLHYGDTDDGTDPVTPEFLLTLDSFLSAVSHCTNLSLVNFSYIPEPDFTPTFSPNAYVPFTRLRSLCLNGFSFYLPVIMRGVRESGVLQHLNIGYGTLFENESLLDLTAHLPALMSLCIACETSLEGLRGLVDGSPLLEEVVINRFDDPGADFVTAAVSLLVRLPALRVFTLNLAMEEVDLRHIAACTGPIETLTLTASVDAGVEGVDDALCELVKAKRATLRVLWVDFKSSEEFLIPFVPSVKLIESLSSCSALEVMGIDCEGPPPEASAALDALLKNCPKLGCSPPLKKLMRGNIMFETVFMPRITGDDLVSYSDDEYNVLGN